MRTIDQLLAEQPFFAGLAPGHLALIAGCAQNVHFTAGTRLFRSGDQADSFYLVRHGRVALELVAHGREPLVIDTIDAGHILGWSWLVPPYRWYFDGRAVEDTSAVALDGACLRTKCDDDPALGYQLLRRVSHVMYERLQSTRFRLLDLYGTPYVVGD